MKRRVYFNKNNKKLNFKLIDNRGIELSNYNIKTASDDTINYINEKIKVRILMNIYIVFSFVSQVLLL